MQIVTFIVASLCIDAFLYLQNMIDVNQWRASIGTFCRFNWTSRSAVITHHEQVCNSSKIMWLFVHLPCFFTIAFYFIFLSLLLSGDIEVNPGPIYRNCPECDQKVHIRQRNCTCGHIFDKKSSFSNPYKPIDSLELSTECATGATQQPICPVPPGSPVDKTSTSVDSEISAGLLSDTAPDVSCGVPVEHSLDISQRFDVSDEIREDHQSFKPFSKW